MNPQRAEGDSYRDRAEAGRILAKHLATYGSEEPAVIALPRGGVPVGFAVARALEVPLELWIVRKLGAPLMPEHAIGAVAEGGARYVDWEEAGRMGASSQYVEQLSRDEKMQIELRVLRFRQGRPPPELEGRTVIVVDDGIATGRSVRAVLQGVRKKRPARVVLAVPVAPRPVLRALAPLVDGVICPQVERTVLTVADFYDDFRQPTDDEVVELVRRAWVELATHPVPQPPA